MRTLYAYIVKSAWPGEDEMIMITDKKVKGPLFIGQTEAGPKKTISHGHIYNLLRFIDLDNSDINHIIVNTEDYVLELELNRSHPGKIVTGILFHEIIS